MSCLTAQGPTRGMLEIQFPQLTKRSFNDEGMVQFLFFLVNTIIETDTSNWDDIFPWSSQPQPHFHNWFILVTKSLG